MEKKPYRIEEIAHALKGKTFDLPMEDALKDYPRLKQYNFEAAFSPGAERNEAGGGLEFFHPEDDMNPRKGSPYIEVYNENLGGQELADALFGDALHLLPDVDPEFSDMREEYWGSRTDDQKAIDQRAYERGQREYGESRPFDKWADMSRKDAHLRGYLAPDQRNEWAGSYSPDQVAILNRMRDYLKTAE
jgi:hypothetical protein